MEKLRLGRTGLEVSRSGFGCLPIQRISFEDAESLLLRAVDGGINFFDTARMYTDSEEKIGRALSGVRERLVLATKTHAQDRRTLEEHLETSLRNMKTDYIDIYQLHNPPELPDPEAPDGIYAGLLDAKSKGLIRHIGITNHSLKNAIQAAESGLYDTVQFPLSSLSSEEDLALADVCMRHGVGLIAMKAMSGGLITKPAATFAFLRQYGNIVPIWGIQRMSELEEFLALEENPPALDENLQEAIKRDREELAGSFCRGCGYCMPCPAGIDIPLQARISLMMKRSPYKAFLEESFRERMNLINGCLNCGSCRERCPYKLDTTKILREELAKYYEFYEKHKEER